MNKVGKIRNLLHVHKARMLRIVRPVALAELAMPLIKAET